MRVTNMQNAMQSISRIQNSAEAVFKSDYQVSTGLKSDKYSDVSGSLSQILSTKDTQSQLKSYDKNLTNMESHLKAVETSLQSMQKILTEATSLATLALNENTPEDRASLAATAEGLAKNLDSLMNQQFQGKYIFSGQATNVPVTNGTSPTAYTGTPVSTSYYQGDQEKLSTIVSEGTVLEYGITGDNQGFADLKAGIEALWYGLKNDDEDSLKGATDLITNAQTNFGSMLGNVGGEMKQVDILQEQIQNTEDFLTEQLQELQGVDSTEAISNLKSNEAVLEANLSLIGRINKISLLDYI
ncbi:MAG TPA: hypothetical protein DCL21_05835 [Alphaproteobacteria bacterium]|nr:hypothetical protein [Alphaproteobacteria bacterium]